MKKIMSISSILILLLFLDTKAQLKESSWAFGFGGSYPMLVGYDVNSSASTNFGGYFSVERRFTEHSALRLQSKYAHLEGNNGSPKNTKSETISLNLDFVYYINPCESFTPYILIGAAPISFVISYPVTSSTNGFNFGGQLNAGIGAELQLSNLWSLTAEGNYHFTLSDKLDGFVNTGFDSYISLNLGAKYYFDAGNDSRICELPMGLTASEVEAFQPVDYNRIEEIVKRYIPREVVKEVIVEKEGSSKANNWVLVGVNFELDSDRFTGESFPILFHAAKTLLQNPEMKVEIQGHTDNIGSETYNQKLSEKRAVAVKNYLAAHGVDVKRLFVKGYGESMPMGDNNTAVGRAMNRRIEFKVISE